MTAIQKAREANTAGEWRYSINYGPEGEANYAFVYDGGGNLVSNLKIHHAIAVVEQMNRCSALAALDAETEVKVRELEWEGDDGLHLRAKTAIGDYSVLLIENNGLSSWRGPMDRYENVETFEAAKAAAQADYERRIRSALVTPGGTVMSGLDEKGLLPCPFCGGRGRVIEGSGPFGSGGVFHAECAADCEAGASFTSNTEAGAAAAWNRRASAPPAPDGLEPVAWRWRPQGGTVWVTWEAKPVPGGNLAEDAVVEIEPLYSAATLSAQEAEIERLHAEANAVSAAIGSPRFMDPPDGGSVTLAEQVERMRHALESAEAKMTEARKVIEPFAYLQQTYAGEISPPSIETVRAVRRWLAAIRNLEPRHD